MHFLTRDRSTEWRVVFLVSLGAVEPGTAIAYAVKMFRPSPRAATLAALLGLTFLAFDADAAQPYLVVEDPGLVADDASSPNKWRQQLLEAYAASGFELPEIISVWTTFPMGGNNFGTIIDPRGQSVEGINLVTSAQQNPPLEAILWHNNFLALDQRSNLHHAPIEGYGEYLFFLELSHLWGPQIQVPDPDPAVLRGFPYHWSFFLDTPGPAGGNTWVDNLDGTFTVVAGAPSTLGFSMLDLCLMGLAEPSEVPPFRVLTEVTVPDTPTDPFWGGPHSARSFPWFDTEAEPLTVTATARELTIDDVVAANGPRVPGAFEQTSWTIGFVLMVPAGTTEAELAEVKTTFDPFISGIAPAFANATMDRGSLEVVTVSDDNEGGMGGMGGAGGNPGVGGEGPGGSGTGGEAGVELTGEDGCACRIDGIGTRSHSDPTGSGVALAAGLLALALMTRRS